MRNRVIPASIPLWVAFAGLLSAACTLLLNHRSLAAAQQTIVPALRAHERAMFRSLEAPTLIEHLVSGVAYSWLALAVVWLLILVDDATGKQPARPTVALRLSLACAALAAGAAVINPAWRFSNVHFAVAAAFTAWGLWVAYTPIVAIRWTVQRPFQSILAGAMLLWATFGLSWEVRQFGENPAGFWQSVAQLGLSAVGIAVGVAMVRLAIACWGRPKVESQTPGM
ncbi:hypothetical protein [Cupriavidus sp. TMH.W2]|uniref:hypothetical protein n=1 Tax=Cupriavidus sp. TMH.W2 TaxID=3434465 RepID=UPI003D76A697